MNRKKARKILEVYGRPQGVLPNGTKIVLSRQDMDDVKQIENMTKEKLVAHWKSMVTACYVIGCSSLNDLQRIHLLELEMESRLAPSTRAQLDAWFNEQLEKGAQYERELEREYNKQQTEEK